MPEFHYKHRRHDVTGPAEIMTEAYMEAAVWTDSGEEFPEDAKFSPLAKCQAFITCRNFLWANEDLIGERYEQAAIDLWLTRNGHGSGFWDRPEIWGEVGSDTLTRCAKAFGERSLYQGG